MIIFLDSDKEEALDPSIFVSDFNHIFCVVRKMSEKAMKKLGEEEGDWETGKTYYQIGFCSKVSQGRAGILLISVFNFLFRMEFILLSLLSVILEFMRKTKNSNDFSLPKVPFTSLPHPLHFLMTNFFLYFFSAEL